MRKPFSKVIYDASQPEIAKVNRLDGTLYLNSQIWKGLPAEQQEFVLLHEEGHLNLQTTDEFEANAYAVSKFAPMTALTNSELGKRIVVMREILTPRELAESAFLIEGIIGAVSGIFQSLPMLGIGSGARQSEMATQAAANVSIIDAQSKANAKKNQTNIIIGVLAGVVLIVIITLYFTFKK